MSYGIKEDQNMPRKKHTPEDIVAKLRQVDVLVSQGVAIAEAVRQIGVTEVTYYRSPNPSIYIHRIHLPTLRSKTSGDKVAEFYSATIRKADRFRGPVLLRDLQCLQQPLESCRSGNVHR